MLQYPTLKSEFYRLKNVSDAYIIDILNTYFERKNIARLAFLTILIALIYLACLVKKEAAILAIFMIT